MTSIIVNCAAVIAGALIGCVFSRKISSSLSDIVQTGAGVITLIIGMQMAFEYESIICLAICLFLGGITGTWIDIDGAILKLGNKLETLVKKPVPEAGEGTELSQENGNKNFAYAFLNASVLFCVGAMAILGSLKAGIDHDYTIIYTKSILDGFMAIVFSASMGIGTAFSCLTILVYQGVLTLMAGVVAPYIDQNMLNELSACGGAMIIMIGINLLGLKKIKTANYLPALIFVVVFVCVQKIFV
ncbi:MAG: DUF554 domain-containing protein [Treponema sp.]|nr:DUF554 domain-containing protein [Candidatus Treponema caballi]